MALNKITGKLRQLVRKMMRVYEEMTLNKITGELRQLERKMRGCPRGDGTQQDHRKAQVT
jgi:hypothetical protein